MNFSDWIGELGRKLASARTYFATSTLGFLVFTGIVVSADFDAKESVMIYATFFFI